MSQSIYGKFQGRDNSCTSGEAASAEIENSPRVTKGLSQFPKNGLAGVVKWKFPKSGEAASGEFLFYHNC